MCGLRRAQAVNAPSAAPAPDAGSGGLPGPRRQRSIRFRNVTKRFPGVVALDGVTFDVTGGECHALIGENGAGKSTLGKILAGILQPDEGAVHLGDVPVRFATPRDAREAGVAVVHQELLFCPNLSVAENVFLGALPARVGVVDRTVLRDRTAAVLAEVGASIDPDTVVGDLSIAQKQLVQIAAAVAGGSDIIVMDEPTSSISRAEAERLFELLRHLKARGVTVIYVSHRMEELFRVSDRISVLRDGRYVGTVRTAQVGEDDIVRMMVGRAIEAYFPVHTERAPGDELLRVERLRIPGVCTEVSFSLHAGEILGLGGLVGAGRSEIARALFGLMPGASGEFFIEGRRSDIRTPRDAMRRGIGLVPEDRKVQGLVLGMTAAENLTLASVGDLGRSGFIDREAERRVVERYFHALSVRPADPYRIVGTFSGGNQQKVVLARWLARECRILIVDEPTRGIDVAAKAEIHALIDRLASRGTAVLLVSSEMPELINLSTRILVLRGGRVCGELSRAEVTQERLMTLMAGIVVSREGNT